MAGAAGARERSTEANKVESLVTRGWVYNKFNEYIPST